ncbi:MAG: EpsI family protein [Desulfuromonas sp.]|nr:MAG: EpsI family protein [Desulfuromonas sp.]
MIVRYRYALLCGLLIVAIWFVHGHELSPRPLDQPLNSLPKAFSGWTANRDTRFDAAIVATLRPTDYLARSYRDAQGQRVSLYVGYHDGGPDSGPVHSPKHCLPGSGWNELQRDLVTVKTADGPMPLVQALYQNGPQREIFLYWYLSRGEVITDEYALKLREVVGAFLHGRRDTAFIRVAVPVFDDPGQAGQIARGFVGDIAPLLGLLLPN